MQVQNFRRVLGGTVTKLCGCVLCFLLLAATPVPGWENMELLAEAAAPFHGQLMVKPLAWTPSTKGVVTGQVVLLDPPGLALPAGGGFNFFGSVPPPPEPKWAAPPMPEKAK